MHEFAHGPPLTLAGGLAKLMRAKMRNKAVVRAAANLVCLLLRRYAPAV
ncbi:hypothetical protein OKW40_005690 [Paraburkholderia sp. RAU6.4a]